MTWYTVYLADTDEIVASGTGPQCAKALKMTISSFYCAVDRTQRGLQHKYVFYKEQIKREDLP